MAVLAPVSGLDCLVFCFFLAIQLLRDVGPAVILLTLFDAIPFFFHELPLHFYHVFRARHGWVVDLDNFSRSASLFEILAVRCMRYAFTNLPLEVAKTFFHKDVALQFFQYRFNRQRTGRRWKGTWEEYNDGRARGIWIKKDASRQSDIVVYYIHGGGYVLGSVWFYLEWLVAFHSTLCLSFENPAIFALSYTLAPKKRYPTQLKEAVEGYCHVLSTVDSPRQVCLAGDSAGGALAMLVVYNLNSTMAKQLGCFEAYPRLTVLISPWMSLEPTKDRPADSDFVSPRSLHMYARHYASAGRDGSLTIDEASALSRLRTNWEAGQDCLSYYIWYGKDETLAGEIKETISLLRNHGAKVLETREDSPDKGIHVWPVASYFLSRTQERRMEGLKEIASIIRTVFVENVNANQKQTPEHIDTDGECYFATELDKEVQQAVKESGYSTRA